MRIMYGAPPPTNHNREYAPLPQGPTALTHPRLGWRRLQGQVQTARGPMQINFNHVLFAILEQDGSVYIHAYSERNGARLDRPCSNPNMAFARVLDWARNYSLSTRRAR